MNRLSLSMETLRVLDDDDLRAVFGGGASHPTPKPKKGSCGKGKGPKSKSAQGPPGCAGKVCPSKK